MRPNVEILRNGACASCVLVLGLITTLLGAPPPGGGSTSNTGGDVTGTSAPSIALGSPGGTATGNGNNVLVAPNASVSASGSLWSMAVYLANHPDGADEFFTCNWNLNSIAQSSSGYDPGSASISFSGGAAPSQYQAVVQSIRYQNNKPT